MGGEARDQRGLRWRLLVLWAMVSVASIGVLTTGACQCIVVLPPANVPRIEGAPDGQLTRERVPQDEVLSAEELPTPDDAAPEPPSPCPHGGPPRPEICDGKDNDCDGQVDEENVCRGCTPDTQRVCGTDVGACKAGRQTCTKQRLWGSCLGAVSASPEVCDGKDNDCDGQIDENTTDHNKACTTTQKGECSSGTSRCTAGRLTCLPRQQPSPEVCDKKDNDCDGSVDEGLSCNNNNGCADGTREGFRDATKYKDIAACSGGWSIPGIHTHQTSNSKHCPQGPPNRSLQPACGRKSGNDSKNPSGQGCSAADLCASGWHICRSADEVSQKSPDGCQGATNSRVPPLFFASRQSGTGCGVCSTGSSTDTKCNSLGQRSSRHTRLEYPPALWRVRRRLQK